MTPSRLAPAALEARFTQCCSVPSDINEHLPILRDYAARCEHVTEFGLRGGNGSTVAFLAAQPKTLVSWDINPFSIVSQSTADLIAETHGSRTRFQPRTGNTLEINIEPTDLLFIDSLHTFDQLYAELTRHCDPKDRRVRRYLGFHDTTTFGLRGEDGKEPGLRWAIRKFQREFAFPLWQVCEDRTNNNGLIILEYAY